MHSMSGRAGHTADTIHGLVIWREELVDDGLPGRRWPRTVRRHAVALAEQLTAGAREPDRAADGDLAQQYELCNRASAIRQRVDFS
eukprot:4449273-Alexandrium_andersonii.AAC.1